MSQPPSQPVPEGWRPPTDPGQPAAWPAPVPSAQGTDQPSYGAVPGQPAYGPGHQQYGPGPGQQTEWSGTVQVQERPEEPGFSVGFTPVTMANQVAMLGSKLRSSIIRTLISAAIWTAIWWWQREKWGSPWILVVGYLVSLVMILATVVQLVQARRALRRIGTGEALRATPSGLVLNDLEHRRTELAWEQVHLVRVEGHESGAGPRICVQLPATGAKKWWQRRSRPQSTWQMPLYYLDALPGTIDGALRAYSRGRHGLDVRGLDSFW